MKITLPENLPLDTLAVQMGLKTIAGQTALKIFLENVKLLDNKQQDYGSENISDFGTYGVVVRINDKFKRIKHLFTQRRKRAVNESVRDSFRDLANYAMIAYMLETNQWPRE